MKTRVSIINYCNTIPFTYGLLRSGRLQEIADFSYGYPSQVADMLCNDKVDISIISVGAIPTIPNAQIISNYCISATQRVDSVMLCSNKPVTEVKTIILDYQSRTTNILVKILAKYGWKICPNYEMGSPGYETVKSPDSAKVIIGDRALIHACEYKYVYDLANEWYKIYNLPFVFAAWVANKPLSNEFITEFEAACQYGVSHIDDAIKSTNKKYVFDIQNYLRHSVEFEMNAMKRLSLKLYFEKAKSLCLI